MSIVWTNGCFDILHRGHIELFKYAKSHADALIVGIDSDEKIRTDKGDDRPYNNLEDRRYVLESIKYIDKVVTFGSREELENTIKEFSPDFAVIGSDWKGKEVVGSEHIKQLIFFDRVGNYSTTNVLKGKK